MKPKKIKVILPRVMICHCSKSITWKKDELASEYEKRVDEFIEKHKHERG